jgi:Rps23 Pro-64 3,4-dihydroxylase Tpa1-like proline 4-hydroxylase
MPVGSALGCHFDGNSAASGGYIFYLCEEWDPHWGGLLVAFEAEPFGAAPRFALLDPARERRELAATRLNAAVVPRRNRLVLLRHPVRHLVTQILPPAGDRVRLAIVGYFDGRPDAGPNASA